MNQLFQKGKIRSPGELPEHRSPGKTDGFTLVEILIAITVLVIGLLGILSLFPYAMSNIQDTAEFTESSVIASSFHQSLLTGVHNAGTRENVVTIHHSGLFNRGDGIKEKYTFPLPKDPLAGQGLTAEQKEKLRERARQGGARPSPTSYWIPCPGQNCLELTYPSGGKIDWGGGGTGRGDSGAYRWQFGETVTGGSVQQSTATSLEDLIRNIDENFDPTISLDQYSVAIIIRNRVTYPEDLYEVLIRVYRTFTTDPNSRIPKSTGGKRHKDLVREYRAKITK